MANVISGNDPAYVLNPKIRTRKRSIIFSNNSFMDSEGRTFLDMSEFSVECKRSASTIIQMNPDEQITIPVFKNVIFTCFGGSVVHMNDVQRMSKQTLHFSVRVDVKNPEGGFSWGSGTAHLNVNIVFPQFVDENDDGTKYVQSHYVSVRRYLSKSGKYFGDSEDIIFEHLDTQIKFNIHYEYDELLNEHGIKISGIKVGGKFSGGGEIDTEINISKKSKVFMLSPNMDYELDGVEGVRFMYDRETWDKLCDGKAVLRKYAVRGNVKDVPLEHDMFQKVFPVEDCRGLSIVVGGDESIKGIQEISVEKIFKKYDESFDCSITCGALIEHDVYRNFGFIVPQGNNVSFKNITRKKIDLQVLSYG